MCFLYKFIVLIGPTLYGFTMLKCGGFVVMEHGAIFLCLSCAKCIRLVCWEDMRDTSLVLVLLGS